MAPEDTAVNVAMVARMCAPRHVLGPRLWNAYTTGRTLWWFAVDRRRIAESSGERVTFHALRDRGFLERFRGGRILEIGPKHGRDSRLLASLDPRELVLLDLPEKDELVHAWLSELERDVSFPVRYESANLLYLERERLDGLGAFDLVWCLGILYHNVEQLRLLRRLFNLTSPQGALVLETATTRDRLLASRNVVEIHWPGKYRGQRTITHLPSRRAVKSWLEMVGFADVSIESVYSRAIGRQRAVLTARRPEEPHPYLSYVEPGAPEWVAGEAS